jgi:hypothetical protein
VVVVPPEGVIPSEYSPTDNSGTVATKTVSVNDVNANEVPPSVTLGAVAHGTPQRPEPLMVRVVSVPAVE